MPERVGSSVPKIAGIVVQSRPGDPCPALSSRFEAVTASCTGNGETSTSPRLRVNAF